MTQLTCARPAALTALLALLAAGCTPAVPSKYQEAQKDTRPAVSKEAVSGGSLNKFFPMPEGEYDRVYTQEKTGFAQAELKKGDKKLALLSIFDTVSEPETAAEYKDSKNKFAGFPLLPKGNLGTAVLVGGRYQVQVRTLPGVDFGEDERKEWIGKFDLAGLSTHQ